MMFGIGEWKYWRKFAVIFDCTGTLVVKITASTRGFCLRKHSMKSHSLLSTSALSSFCLLLAARGLDRWYLKFRTLCFWPSKFSFRCIVLTFKRSISSYRYVVLTFKHSISSYRHIVLTFKHSISSYRYIVFKSKYYFGG